MPQVTAWCHPQPRDHHFPCWSQGCLSASVHWLPVLSKVPGPQSRDPMLVHSGIHTQREGPPGEDDPPLQGTGQAPRSHMICKGGSPTGGSLPGLPPPHHPPSPHSLQSALPMVLGTPAERVKHPVQDGARLRPALRAFGCPSAGRSGNGVTLWVSLQGTNTRGDWGTNR